MENRSKTAQVLVIIATVAVIVIMFYSLLFNEAVGNFLMGISDSMSNVFRNDDSLDPDKVAIPDPPDAGESDRNRFIKIHANAIFTIHILDKNGTVTGSFNRVVLTDNKLDTDNTVFDGIKVGKDIIMELEEMFGLYQRRWNAII